MYNSKKQKMMENRLKFDRDVVLNGDLEDDEEWDPWDLEDEELQVLIRDFECQFYVKKFLLRTFFVDFSLLFSSCSCM